MAALWTFFVLVAFHICDIIVVLGGDISESYEIYLQSRNGSRVETNTKIRVTYNFSQTTLDYIRGKPNSEFFLGITYEDSEKYRANVLSINREDNDASIYLKRYHAKYHRAIRLEPETINLDYLTVNETDLPGIMIYIRQIGHVSFEVDLLELSNANKTVILTSKEYPMTAIRKLRKVDTSFNVAVTILGILNTFALGCVTDIGILKEAASRKIHILLSVVTQYVLMPMVSTQPVQVEQYTDSQKPHKRRRL